MPARQRKEGAGKEVAKGHLQACCTAHLSSLNSNCGGRVRGYNDTSTAAGTFWYIVVYREKLASMSSD